MSEELKELLKSIKNRCEISLFLIDNADEHKERWLPTVLEDMYIDSQTIVNDYCVVRKTDGSA